MKRKQKVVFSNIFFLFIYLFNLKMSMDFFNVHGRDERIEIADSFEPLVRMERVRE